MQGDVYIMADIIYTLEGGVYFNITNQCPCNCAFCIRNQTDTVGEAKEMWYHGSEPTLEEVKAAIDQWGFSNVDNAVFCGYGEPTCRLDVLLAAARYLRTVNPQIKLRLNTNGLSDLINRRPTAKEIGLAFDSVSISLNEPDSDAYDKITRNIYPGRAYPAMLDFAKECGKYCDDVRLSVVDVIGAENIAKSKKIADDMGVKFVCRSFDKGR